MTRNPPGRLYNWKTRQNVFNCIDDYIGSHGKAVLYASWKFNVSDTTIYDWIRDGCIVHVENQTRNGDNNVIMSTYHTEYLISYLSNIDCQLYHPEMIKLLYDTFGELYTKHQIRNALKANNFTHKVIEQVAGEQNNIVRGSWIDMIQISFPATWLEFIDETKCNISIARRKYGYALRGKPAYVRRNGTNGLADSFSSIASFSLNGIDTVTSYDIAEQGNIDTEKFLHALRYVIFPSMNRYGTGPRCVAVLDNCRIHNKDEIYAIAAEFGIKVLFLPTYSYDFNPIELCFHLSKALIKKRNNDNRNGNGKSLMFQFEEALLECCDRSMAAQLFRHCFIPVDLDE